MSFKLLAVLFILYGVAIVNVEGDFPQLHRALPGSNGKPGYRLTSSGISVTTDSGVSQDKHGSVTDKNSRTKKYQSKMDFESDRSTTFALSIASAILVGLSGILPLAIIPLEAGPSLKHGAGSSLLKLLLSFAVGSLLGDVFLHLLPETWATVSSAKDPHWAHTVIGLWIIGGILSFMIIEKMFMDEEEEDEEEEEEQVEEKEDVKAITKLETNGLLKNGHVVNGTVVNGHGLKQRHTKEINGTVKNGSISNGHVGNGHIGNGHVGNGHIHHEESEQESEQEGKEAQPSKGIKISGYLNLLANCIDNFTHGLAVAGSYLISPKVGMCTTIAILLHEIPHEVGDFAILLRSGFDRWKAAKAQVLTASCGVLGAMFALYSDSAESAGDKTAAILPFTAGGFIYIALVTVVPDLLKEKCPKESIKQVACIVAGIVSMILVTIMFE